MPVRKSVKTNRWGETRAAVGDERGEVEFVLSKPGPIGCRLAALAMSHAVDLSDGIENLPTRLTLRSGRHDFAPRARLTVDSLNSPALRKSFMDGYSWHHVPALSNEDWRQYETRAVNETSARFTGYHRLDRKLIHVGGPMGHPDALLRHPEQKRLVIVETKKRPKDFAEGTAQLIQTILRQRHGDIRFSGGHHPNRSGHVVGAGERRLQAMGETDGD